MLDDKRKKEREQKDKEEFEKRIRSDPCDWTTRGVYADWLSEHGYDDEAAEQYRYGKEEVRAAVTRLVEIASEAGEHCESGYAEDIDRDAYYKARDAWFDGGRKGREPDYDDKEFQTGIPEVWRKVTYWDLLDAGTRYVDSSGNDWFTQVGNEDLRDNIQGELLDEYWKCWEMITGRSKIPPNGYGEGSPFSCSC